MIAKFAKKINEILIQKGIVQKEDAELYRYGIENGIVVHTTLATATNYRRLQQVWPAGTWWAKRSLRFHTVCGQMALEYAAAQAVVWPRAGT